MQRFLDKVSHHILTRYPDDISRLCIVLPNRRAGLFLKKSLSEMAGKTIWSPDVFSIEDFCVQISGYNLSDPVGLLFRFYDIHRQLEADQAQSFDDFIQWAQVLLSDFNEIDQHMVDAGALFHYLSEAKAIEKWSPENPHLSETVKGYLRFYRSLFDYYTALRENAEKNRQGWQGLIFRHVAENIETIATGLKWKRIIFAGFNALTVAEKKITTTLTQMGMAEMLWDADSYYLDDTNQEAGIFLRKIMRETGKQQFRWVEDNFREIEKKITICGVPKNLGQAGYAAQILQHWIEQNPQTSIDHKPGSELSNAALVLADENLLFPVLSSLNDDMQEFNVTMGFPVKFSTTYQFFSLLFRLYENAERFLSVGGGKSKGFYFTDLLNLFSHPYSRRLLDATHLISVVKKSNRVFYSPEHMTELITTCSNPPEQLFAQLFKTSETTPQLLLDIFSFVIELLKNTFIREKSNPEKTAAAQIELEHLYHFAKINRRVQGLMIDQHPVRQIKTLRKVYDFIVRVTKIPFEGEPLQGLQVMGLLETRTLDFDRVILLSANEGTLPATSFSNSFIPVDIQREFGLPVVQEKNAVFAYHFYRLLQRAKEIHLVYNTEPDELGGGEPSRFIQQLLHELQKYQPAHEIQKTILSFPVPMIAGEQEITIFKDDTVYAGLMKKAQSGLSPTSLNRYKSCPLRFYFYDIAGIQLPDEVEETIEMQSIGSIVHRALEILYTPYLQKKVSIDDVDKMLSEARGAIARAFTDEYSGGDISFGRNRLISEVIKNFVKKFLESEKVHLETISRHGQILTILGLEEKMVAKIVLEGPDTTEVTLKGIIDRVDSLDGLVRIIDYKTGRVEKNEFHFPSFDHFVASDKNDKSFQVLLYAWLFQQQYNQSEPRYKSGVISMRSLSGGLFAFAIKESRTADPDDIIDRQKLMKFEEMLQGLLTELFDRSIPFTQTANTDHCKNCDFKDICVRG